MNINVIPYSSIIKTVKAKYLIKSTYKKENNRFIYTFTCKPPEDRHYFEKFVARYECWKRINPFQYTWETKSSVLADLERNSKEVADDTHTVDKFSVVAQNHVQDASRYAHEYVGEFNQNTPHINNEFNQKEKEMKKMKVSFDTRIEVNEKVFVIHKPDTAARAAVPILELSKRINFLEAEATELKDSLGDKAKAGKIFAMFNDEIEECQELIDYINECIED